MDQLKPILENAYKYRFWIICGLVVSLSLVFSFLAASSTRAQIRQEKDAITASFDQVRMLSSKENPPNDKSHKAMEGKITAVKEGVREAWQKQYDNQNLGPNKLEWPVALGKDFIDEVLPLHPIEKITYPTPPEDEILDLHRLNYRNYIKKELPALSAIIGAKWHPVNEYVTATDDDDKKYLVEWAASNQTFLQDSRFDWGNTPPSTLDVLYSQEDLWVLRTLLQVIKDTNGSVEARYKAAIKRIDSILLGQDVTAMQDDAQLRDPDKAGGADGGFGGMDSSSGGMGMEMGMGMEEGMDGGGGAGMGGGGAGGGERPIPSGTRADPAHLRYVDNNFEGVGAKTVRDALTNPTGDNAIYAVAKRIPVRIQMSIDQRRLNKFLALCGNAPLQIEVKRVRINRKSSSNPTGGGGGGMGMGMGMDEFGGEGGEMGDEMMEGAGAMEGNMGGEMMGGGGQVTELADESPLDVDVEIYGMVYIYNPVDSELLGIPAAPQQPAAPSTTGVPVQDAATDNQNAAAQLPAANPAG